jgi:nucleoside triphosphate diphosphatase
MTALPPSPTTQSDDAAATALGGLLDVMRRLRDPQCGCPWDITQTFATIAPYTIEEAYEVAAAIERGDMAELKDELGDLLLQVVFHAQMANEAHAFDFAAVAHAITTKMIARHPHVFGSGAVADAAAQTTAWEVLKAEERQRRAALEGRAPGVLDGVALGLPALLRAVKLQKRAARVGFDWTDTTDVLDKIAEEIDELRVELRTDGAASNHDRIEDEFGDVLFALANLARHLDIDPEAALRRTNGKFERRFRGIEAALSQQGRTPAQASLDEMEALWVAIKRAEKADQTPPR